MVENIIEVSHLKKSFKDHHVLKDVNFSVKKGSIFALLGSNGAGKTTIIKILSTLTKANSGSVSICGFDVDKEANMVRDCISLTGQFVAVDEVLSGKENLKLIGELKRIKNVNKKVDEWLVISNLIEAANQKVSTYSGGMKRRLDIAMSLMGNPSIVFLDEPTTGLDPQNRIAMWKFVEDLAAKGTTIVLTTQYLEEAEQLADDIAILHNGKIIARGTPQYLKEIVPTNGAKLSFESEKEAEKALKLLQKSDINVESFEQNMPTLEAVFLSLIDDKKETIHHETKK